MRKNVGTFTLGQRKYWRPTIREYKEDNVTQEGQQKKKEGSERPIIIAAEDKDEDLLGDACTDRTHFIVFSCIDGPTGTQSNLTPQFRAGRGLN